MLPFLLVQIVNQMQWKCNTVLCWFTVYEKSAQTFIDYYTFLVITRKRLRSIKNEKHVILLH